MNYLLTISLFAISIALGVWGYCLQDDSFGVLAASVIVGAGALGSLQRGRLLRRRQLRRGDFDFLSGELISLGLEEADVEELRDALEADSPVEIVRKQFTVKTIAECVIGEQVSAWIKKTTDQLAEKYSDNTGQQLEQLVITPILEYYGCY
tara:strand:- start:865 stop:1317 length:453 start_codon:yes stop_codon:yes gene_type:complete